MKSADYEIWWLTQQHEYKLQVNQTKEIKQQLVEILWSSLQHLSEKMQFLCFSISQGSADTI